VLLWPLFAWRWARGRHRDNLTLLLIVTACAAVQAALIAADPIAGEAPTPLRPLMLAAVLGSRLVVWPLLGPKIAEALPLWSLALIGTTVFGSIVGWVLRADPRRELRAKVLFVLVILAASGAWRCRADTWETANLTNGDRYFFIPRVLLLWLVIWEFDARPRVVAWIARAFCFAAALLELPQHRLPAPPDYHWAEHCDAIRRGVPASIPTLPEGGRSSIPAVRHHAHNQPIGHRSVLQLPSFHQPQSPRNRSSARLLNAISVAPLPCTAVQAHKPSAPSCICSTTPPASRRLLLSPTWSVRP